GVDRTRFFIRTSFMFLLNGFMGIFAGILILNFLGGIDLSATLLIQLTILTFSSAFLVIASAIFLGEALSLPELSSVILVLIFGLNTNLNNNESSIWYKLMQSELLFAEDNIILPLILSLSLGVVIIGVSFVLHAKQDVEL
ncbi:MAG: hypothetical protein ACW99A_20715, partial [Candidatus Kariarchaeaceae archaeon]